MEEAIDSSDDLRRSGDFWILKQNISYKQDGDKVEEKNLVAKQYNKR